MHLAAVPPEAEHARARTLARFAPLFRPIDEVIEKLHGRPNLDEALLALLWQYKNRGEKAYELTRRFFDWFGSRFGQAYIASGPTGAGRDIRLSKVLSKYLHNTAADILIKRRSDGTPLVVGFARYDSERGGAQAYDRTGGNSDKVAHISAYAEEQGLPLKVLFVNDGPGLIEGEMWGVYSQLEATWPGRVLVCTLRILDERLTPDWLEG